MAKEICRADRGQRARTRTPSCGSRCGSIAEAQSHKAEHRGKIEFALYSTEFNISAVMRKKRLLHVSNSVQLFNVSSKPWFHISGLLAWQRLSNADSRKHRERRCSRFPSSICRHRGDMRHALPRNTGKITPTAFWTNPSNRPQGGPRPSRHFHAGIAPVTSQQIALALSAMLRGVFSVAGSELAANQGISRPAAALTLPPMFLPKTLRHIVHTNCWVP